MRSVRKDSPIPRYAVVVPESLVQEVLRGIHDSPFAGHLGVTRTLDRTHERFCWPGMRESVESHIGECSACAQGKDAPNTNKAPLRSSEVGEPFFFILGHGFYGYFSRNGSRKSSYFSCNGSFYKMV